MQLGLISRIVDYYSSSPKFVRELEQAVKVFFAVSTVADLAVDQITETEHGLFNEWFLFDFVLPDGNTMLEHFIDVNPHQLEPVQLKAYERMRDTQHYGLFEVISIQLGSGLALRDIHTNTTYSVRERAATYQVQLGHLVPQRVAMFDDSWELVGSNTVSIPITLDKEMRKIFHNASVANQFTPQTVRQWLKSYNTQQTSDQITPAVAEAHLAQALCDYGIEQMVSVTTIKHWIDELGTKERPLAPIQMVVGLVDKDRFLPDDMQPLVAAIIEVMNTSPRQDLNGKSPHELMSERAANGKSPRFYTKTSEVGGQWLQLYEQAYTHMAEGKIAQAIQKYDAVFKRLLNNREVDGQIYRVFTNNAIAYFAFGEKLIGKKLLQLALQLNPNYDFGQLTMMRLQSGLFEVAMKDARQQRKYIKKKMIIQPWRAHAALEYYRWIQTLGINFKTAHLTTTPVVDLN